jgi:hypothetical protein
VPVYVADPGDISPDMLALLHWAGWVLSLPVMVFSSGPFWRQALSDVRQGRIGMDVPVVLGMAITFVVSTAATWDPTGPWGAEVYFDSLTMFVFFLLTGRWLEGRMRDRTAGALDALMNRLPEQVQRLNAQGELETVAATVLQVGDTVRIGPGQAFPVDARVVQGSTWVEEALLTGESKPLARHVNDRVLSGSHNLRQTVDVVVTADDGVRADTTAEGLSKLKAAFSTTGTTTAGNSSQVSDGAAATLVMSRAKAESLGLPILGVVRSYAVVGVEPEVMGIGPAKAIPAALAKAGLSLGDIDVFEINEAFASQAVYCVRELGIDVDKVNPNGGAIALGHPLGCTGAKLTATLLHEMKRRSARYGVVSMCIGGGMGAAAVFEREEA